MKNKHGIDLDEVIRNAQSEGIDLSEITLFYADLTDWEISELSRHNLLVQRTNQRTIAKFNAEGIALFSEKVSEVYYLGS